MPDAPVAPCLANAEQQQTPEMFRFEGLYWGYMGIMKKKMETTIMGYIGFIQGV